MTTAIPDSHRDLLDAGVGVLAMLDRDGRPQMTVVWFLAEGDVLRLSLNTERYKVRNLRRDPSVGLLLLDLAAPTRYLEVRGDAEIADDPDYSFADRVGAKYGADLRAFDGDNASRVVVTLRPTRVTAVDMAAGG
jgi:PPOX class probable F420-dependent enzyme